MDVLTTRPDAVPSPPAFLDEVADVIAEFTECDDAALIAYLAYHQGALEWGGLLLQGVVPRDGIAELPTLTARVVGHWDVLLWQAAICVASVRRLPAGRSPASSTSEMIAQTVVDLAAVIWQVAHHPLVADPDTRAPSPVRLPWFGSIPEEERLWIETIASQRDPEGQHEDRLIGVTVRGGREPTAPAST